MYSYPPFKQLEPTVSVGLGEAEYVGSFPETYNVP